MIGDTIFSAGDCPVCSDMGGVFFVKARSLGRIFFFCPHCGVAWEKPPAPWTLDSIDPPDKFAPEGMEFPEEGEIKRAGLWGLVAKQHPLADWGSFFEGYIATSEKAG